jgi:CCR4-NOT transcription complex subunit 7/8
MFPLLSFVSPGVSAVSNNATFSTPYAMNGDQNWWHMGGIKKRNVVDETTILPFPNLAPSFGESYQPQQQLFVPQSYPTMTSPSYVPTTNAYGTSGMSDHFVNVYAYNLLDAMRELDYLVRQGNFIALDTEFPGVVIEGELTGYEKIRSNVSKTKLVQLGISVFNSDGQCLCTYQFNFSYNGIFNPASREMLEKAGIDFQTNARYGISHAAFGSALRSTSLLRNPNLVWICFHGAFDLAYLVQVLLGGALPADFATFSRMQRLLFPHSLDLKTLANASLAFQGGLERLAEMLFISRKGTAHQAGSDSLLTGDCFFELLSVHEEAQKCYHGSLNQIAGFA